MSLSQAIQQQQQQQQQQTFESDTVGGILKASLSMIEMDGFVSNSIEMNGNNKNNAIILSLLEVI